ncbi:hypothetical protein K431DRAFT_228850 [Polychaeton citri CBS 116435]|uniref:Interferon-induced GTP-binding protein Mx n=1 Tax=Polychaeton citri CBS 116435 TaxID=1314669 RepID=A0A9P4Q4U0_9PEZI|nr:hypothetical protein K431DRAFT_228850 [Polychaeton citri CBS 116435]
MGLPELQSKDHRDLLDIIDSLRSKGINQYVALPEILVCGDQSAGKSSILEAISGMSFPTKDNLCTRFVTELVLRRHSENGAKASIIPGPERSAGEREMLTRFDLMIDASSPDLGDLVERAKTAMGLSDAKVFSTDTLRVELSGPNQPHLTMVDLPGLFRAGNREQSLKDAVTVRTMVRERMKQTRSIILAVVSANSDFALQEITELARELDPNGMRTLGLITKPDKLDPGSDSEASYVKLAQNNDVKFRLGWHVLKNRSFDMRGATSAERDSSEEDFFSTGAWTAVNPRHLGAKTLKSRLSKVLKDQILLQLPSLLTDVEKGVLECRTELKRLGVPRANLSDQRSYLLRVSQTFSSLMKCAVDGIYVDPFFGRATTHDGRQKRLRAIVQNALADFKEDVRVNGQDRQIVDPESESEDSKSPKISRADFIEEVKSLMRCNRGRELPGTFNPMIIGELFTAQCQPWRFVAADAKQTILHAIDRMTRAILYHAAVDEVASGLLQVLGRNLDALKSKLDEKMEEILHLHYNGHPITYNRYLTDSVQKVQAARRRQHFQKAIEICSGGASLDAPSCTVNPARLMALLEEHTDVDMETHASDLAIDYMLAYYKVALKRFIDDFSILAIEDCLMGELPSLFTPETVYNLPEEEIIRLASEDEETAAERTSFTAKLKVLESGRYELERLNKHRTPLLGK